MKRIIELLCLLTLLQGVALGQPNLANVFTVEQNDTMYKFAVEKLPKAYIIKFINPDENSTKGADSIFSIEDHVALAGAIMKTAKVSYTDANKIADKLYEKYSARQHTIELQSRINVLENDKGANIGVISLRGDSVKAFLISRKKFDKKNFSKDKAQIEKRKECLDSIKEKKGEELIKGEKRCSCLHKTTISGIDYLQTKKHICFFRLRRYYKKSTAALKLNRTEFKLEIDSVDIAFENGIIKDIVVRTRGQKVVKKNGKKGKDTHFNFSNWGYIPVRSGLDVEALSSKDKNYLTSLFSNDSVLVIDLADVIYYNRKITFSSGTYITKDTALTITKAKQIVQLKKPTMSDNFDIRIFTDALGYNKNAPNGIVQGEAQLNFCLNQWRNRYTLFKIWKKDYAVKNVPIGRYQFLFLNRISPYFKISKIEKSNSQLPIDTSSKKGNLMDVFKYGHLDVGTELNLVTLRTDSKLFTLNMAFGAFRTKIGNDSIDSKNLTISTIYSNPNIDFKFFESNKIDFNIRIGLYGAWIVSPVDSASLMDMSTSIKNYVFDKTNWWCQFQQSFNLHPGGNSQNSIFIRSAQYFSTSNNHFTFQIGYSSTLSKLFNF